MLVPRGDFHVGQAINKFLRLPMSLPSATTALQRHAVWFGTSSAFIFIIFLSFPFVLSSRDASCLGTLCGGVGYLAPIDETVFRRLGMLQSALLSAIPHAAGLHPQAYRALQRERMLRNRKVRASSSSTLSSSSS